MASTPDIRRNSSVDAGEVERFSIASEWWDANGKMRMLHRLNPARLAFIKEVACRQFGRDGKRLDALAGLRMLDVGCGGGILSEPLARLGALVVGADPSGPNIEVAKLHAARSGFAIDYRATTAEALAEAGERFDVVLAMEVVEHVADLGSFVAACVAMVRPAGLMLVATINRTLKSYALAIVGAEYVLGWLPRGTHQWDKLITPNEIELALAQHGLELIDETGVIYDLLSDRWQLSTNMDINYMVAAQKPPTAAVVSA
ncbi:MAG: bifunctional 2-polyprenyl-6-hydroxyphenol methylase/3-demethylubiquinol 3-O-methyltransferase UbiG [Xanthobacteraceae bacterium]